MNEQLIVKNFGPIEDATVDFKRVTVFIGPTGGGKSTLAKLAAIFKAISFFDNSLAIEQNSSTKANFERYGIENFNSAATEVDWKSHWLTAHLLGIDNQLRFSTEKYRTFENQVKPQLSRLIQEHGVKINPETSTIGHLAFQLAVTSSASNKAYWELIGRYFSTPRYVPADRVLAAFMVGNTFRLQSQMAGIESILIDFLGEFETARDFFAKREGLPIPFLTAHYHYQNNENLVRIINGTNEVTLPLAESASGIQATVPLVAVTAYEAQRSGTTSFIIEEPELNLYPTAQQGLLNWLVEKCTKGENDLTITTHSPYILSSCNLLLEAYKVAQLRPDLEDEIAAIVPKACWLNPDDFAAYYVADGTVKPITDERTHLIGGNELDSVSGDISDSFHKLLRLKKQVA